MITLYQKLAKTMRGTLTGQFDQQMYRQALPRLIRQMPFGDEIDQNHQNCLTRQGQPIFEFKYGFQSILGVFWLSKATESPELQVANNALILSVFAACALLATPASGNPYDCTYKLITNEGGDLELIIDHSHAECGPSEIRALAKAQAVRVLKLTGIKVRPQMQGRFLSYTVVIDDNMLDFLDRAEDRL